jgi:putative transposase
VVKVSSAEREELDSIARSRSLPHSLVRRARIVLMSADGVSNGIIAERCGVSVPTVSHWRRRWRECGVAGLHGELRPGRPRSYDDERVAALMRKVLRSRPPNATHWSVRSAAAASGISKSTVARYFALFGVQPHRSKSFKLSTDPFFVEKVREVVGLYLNPPDKALVLCVDEKSQVQALERTQPVLPMGLGYVEGVTHDYYRHGTTTLFAALDVLDGKVVTQCKPRHRHQEFLGFLRHLDANVLAGLEVHLIADNYGTHKHPKVREWLVRHPHWVFHFTPTSASWLNAVENFFSVITRRRIRRGVFRSIVDLQAAINRYIKEHNQDPRPFVWTKPARDILAKTHHLPAPSV